MTLTTFAEPSGSLLSDRTHVKPTLYGLCVDPLEFAAFRAIAPVFVPKSGTPFRKSIMVAIENLPLC
jgi:hypothetical protein